MSEQAGSEPRGLVHPAPSVGMKAVGVSGSYVWDLRRDEWIWSPELFAIHGVDPSTTPTTQLLLRLKHGEDWQRAVKVIESAKRTGEPFSCEHRIVRADDGAVRRVVVVGEVDRDDAGSAVRMHGSFIDITDIPGELADYQEHGPPLLRVLTTSTSAVWWVLGEVDMSNREHFAAALKATLDHPGDIVLDLRYLTFIDCRSTDLLVATARRLGHRRRLVLDSPSSPLRRMLELYQELPPNLVIRGRPG